METTKHNKDTSCKAVEVDGEVAVIQTWSSDSWLVEKIQDMTDDNLAEFFGHFTEIMDAFYEPVVGVRRFALKPHVEPQELTEEMLAGVEQFVPGMPYDVFIYDAN